MHLVLCMTGDEENRKRVNAVSAISHGLLEKNGWRFDTGNINCGSGVLLQRSGDSSKTEYRLLQGRERNKAVAWSTGGYLESYSSSSGTGIKPTVG